MTTTVITINFNTGTSVSRTIESILAQDAKFQWLVIDAKSTDGSLESLKSALRSNDELISEPDKGIADAMNKGIRRSSGDAILFMNAGDSFAEPTSLSRLLSGWDRTKHAWAYGDAWIHTADGHPLYLRRESDTRFRTLLGRRCGVQHAGAVVERSLFDRLGPFDTTYRLAFDYEFWVRCFAAGHPPQHVAVPVSRFYLGGASGDVCKRDSEWRRARRQHSLTNSWPVEAWLSAISRAKHLSAPLLRRCRWAYRAKEALGW